MQMAKKIGSTFSQAHVVDKKGSRKRPVAVPIHITHSCDDYAPMELGAAVTFCVKCYLFGRFGHKAA